MKRLKINNFSAGIQANKSDELMGLNVPKMFYNQDLAKGSITGIKNVSSGADSVLLSILADNKFSSGKIGFYKRFDFSRGEYINYLMLFDLEHKGYFVNLTDSPQDLVELGISFTSSPKMINYRLNGEDVLILVSETDNMVVWNGESAPEIILDAPKIKSMDIHYERLFAVTSGGDNTELKFSDDLDPTNWSESLSDAGFISLVDERGALQKVVSFNDYLYVFRDYGITRVYANTSLQSSFYVNQLFVSGGRILSDTLSLCGDRIIFLATDGFYCFDGADTVKILSNISPKIRVTGQEEAIFFDGKYYLSCNIDFGDGSSPTENNAILVVTIKNQEVSIIKNIIPQSLALVNGELLILNGSADYPRLIKIGAGEEINLEGEFQSIKSDLGEFEKPKVIRRIKLKQSTPTEVELTICSDNSESRVFEINSTHFVERVLLSGVEFWYKLKTKSSGAEILSLELDFETKGD